jgi:hypothetical protein
MRTEHLAILVSLLGCSNDFARYSNLSTPRVLAIQSEPAMPRANLPATFQALTFVPEGGSASYHWSYCPVTAKAADRYACPISLTAASAVFGPSLPDYDLGTAPETSFTHGFDPAALTSLCKSGIATPEYAGAVDCDLGFPITVVLDLTTGPDTLRAGFQVYLPVDDQTAPNTNPALEDMLADAAPLTTEPFPATPEKPLVLSVLPAADAVELRPIPAFEGTPGIRAERLTFSWFSNSGSWDKDRTSFLAGDTTLAAATTNTWTAPKADGFDKPTSFYVVARDDRGGVSWIGREVRLEPRP